MCGRAVACKQGPPHILASPGTCGVETCGTCGAAGAALASQKGRTVSLCRSLLWAAGESLMTRAGRAPVRAGPVAAPLGSCWGARGSRQGCSVRAGSLHRSVWGGGMSDAAAGGCAGAPAWREPAAQGGETWGWELFWSLCLWPLPRQGSGCWRIRGSCLNAASQSACAGNPAPAGPADQREDNPGFREEEDGSEVAVGPIGSGSERIQPKRPLAVPARWRGRVQPRGEGSSPHPPPHPTPSQSHTAAGSQQHWARCRHKPALLRSLVVWGSMASARVTPAGAAGSCPCSGEEEASMGAEMPGAIRAPWPPRPPQAPPGQQPTGRPVDMWPTPLGGQG